MFPFFGFGRLKHRRRGIVRNAFDHGNQALENDVAELVDWISKNVPKNQIAQIAIGENFEMKRNSEIRENGEQAITSLDFRLNSGNSCHVTIPPALDEPCRGAIGSAGGINRGLSRQIKVFYEHITDLVEDSRAEQEILNRFDKFNENVERISKYMVSMYDQFKMMTEIREGTFLKSDW